jgi:hypothetical protein
MSNVESPLHPSHRQLEAGAGDPPVFQLLPKTRHAKARVREHVLKIERSGRFRGEQAVLVRCTHEGCGWLGWFTDSEAAIVVPADTDAPDAGADQPDPDRRASRVADPGPRLGDLGKHRRSGVAVPAPRPAPVPAPAPQPSKPVDPVPAGGLTEVV